MTTEISGSPEAVALARIAGAAREVQAASAALEKHFGANGGAQPSTLELARFAAAMQEVRDARVEFDRLIKRRHGPSASSPLVLNESRAVGNPCPGDCRASLETDAPCIVERSAWTRTTSFCSLRVVSVGKDRRRGVPDPHVAGYKQNLGRLRSSAADFSRDYTMATASGLTPSQHGQPSESLLTLAEYLELALYEGECVVLMRHGTDVCAVYIGDPAGSQDELAAHGTIGAALADAMLELTEAGANRITIGDLPYQFIRSFTHVADYGAVVFAPV